MMDEKAIMFEVQNGQLDKLATLFENNHVALFNYFLRSGHNRSSSEDLVQETFMKVLAYRSSFNGSSSFRSWLFGIARNTAVDHYRKYKNTQHHEDIEEMEVSNNENLTDTMEQKQRDDFFAKSLAQLPDEQRDILILSRFHQLNYEEISNLLGCNINTLKSRMRKAVESLQDTFNRLTNEVKS